MVTLYLYLGGKWVMPGTLIISIAYMFVPMIMAIVVQKLIYKEPLKEPLGISFKLNRWFLVAWLLPPLIALATLGVSLLLPGVEFSPQMAGLMERFKSTLTPEQLRQMEQQMTAFPIHPFLIALLQGLIAGITVNAVAGFGEELGWRGLLQKEFGFMGFWRSSALIGVIWGIWHAPLILLGHNYPQHPVAGVFMMTVFTLLLSPIFSYVRLKAKSVIAAAIIHGSLNATVGLALMVVAGGTDLTIGVTGLAGFIVLALVNLCLFLYDRFLAKETKG
ncbi:MAG: CPBP family intramembrane metalloprotease [Chloroflexi bacterium]|nr:CPBP family intramembrane metalloprotease [Chloroflexota bacterium]MBM3172861.1 CPBP family intramembrane metalloprotease [Chloroflexota bacterium]MBM3174259.1 CPBP family intramembrane metalloprotease [Chloroflexota bacterium]MBM4449510.1 CPBP family intramembrane metalloprotease [Chloroflexota bacterium]